MSETNSEDAIVVPEMVNLDSLTKIIVAYEKAGGVQKEVASKEVGQISGIDPSNVGKNNKFFASIGLLEGKRGGYKLTTAGSEYAQALDWGRLEEAQSLLKKIIKDKPLVRKTVSYVELNKPVQKDDLIAKIAVFANVPNQPRFSTGIKAFVEMLTLSRVLEETKDGLLTTSEKEESKETKSTVFLVEPKTEKLETYNTMIDYLDSYFKSVPSSFYLKRGLIPPVEGRRTPLAFVVTINVDNNTEPEKLKQIIKALQEAVQTSS